MGKPKTEDGKSPSLNKKELFNTKCLQLLDKYDAFNMKYGIEKSLIVLILQYVLSTKQILQVSYNIQELVTQSMR